MRIGAILLAAGESRRFGGTVSKLFSPLGEKEVYRHAYDTMIESDLFDEIILVTSDKRPMKGAVMGGNTRQESCYQGLLACNQVDFVVIHDAARPFLSYEILKRNIDAVVKHNAINTCIPSYDTINFVSNEKIDSIPNRSTCWRGQTPQSFSYDLILEAHQRAKDKNAFDDCSLVLDMGHPVHVVLGSNKNLKITTPIDLAFAKALLYTAVN